MIISTLLILFFLALTKGDYEPPACFDDQPVDLFFRSLGQNNLGGLGPDSGDPYIRIENAGQLEKDDSETIFDIILTVENEGNNEYVVPSPYGNTLVNDTILNIHHQLKSSDRNDGDENNNKIDLTFVKPGTMNDAVVLPRTYLGFYDFDNDNRQMETFCIDLDQFTLDKSFIPGLNVAFKKPDVPLINSEIRDGKCDGSTSGNHLYVESLQNGAACDNPTDPYQLGFVNCDQYPVGGGWQQDKAILLALENVEKVTFYAGLKRKDTGKRISWSRNFLIAGRSNQEVGCDYDPPVPTKSPTKSPTATPTATPTVTPTKSPTKSPTKTSDDEPTDRPTPSNAKDCPKTQMILSVDRSRSIDAREMAAQKLAMLRLFDYIDVNEEAITFSAIKFGANVEAVVPPTTSREVVEQTIEDFVGSNIKRQPQTNITSVIEYATEVLPEDGIMVLISDGNARIKGKRGEDVKKDTCDAARSFKSSKPNAKIFCLQSGKEKKKSNVFSCMCDKIWSTNAIKKNVLKSAQEIGKEICSITPDRPDSPCGDMKSKSKCLKIKGDPTNGNISKKFKHKVCSWKQNNCVTSKRFVRFFN